MTATAHAGYKPHARIIKALAHPTRLFIVDELSRGERCVLQLTDMIGVEMPTASRHLGVLRNVGILEDEKRSADFLPFAGAMRAEFFQVRRSDAQKD